MISEFSLRSTHPEKMNRTHSETRSGDWVEMILPILLFNEDNEKNNRASLKNITSKSLRMARCCHAGFYGNHGDVFNKDEIVRARTKNYISY